MQREQHGARSNNIVLLSKLWHTVKCLTLDLTELRNKVSKLKVNPRGNLWATGHFMGKKSIVDSSFVQSAIENIKDPTGVRDVSPLHRVGDLQALLRMLKTAQQRQREQARDM
uniref:Neuromedin Ba n=1 Tax=Amphilophus citrinellus TaxID=61819 RepID=A0A3Q0QSK5_AMPCI